MNRVILIVASLFIVGCSKCKDVECAPGATNRVGARCVDGTTSEATGSGACSGHGGVDYWLCEECD